MGCHAELIEIEKLTTTKNGLGIPMPEVKKESIKIANIQRFRAWHNKEGENNHVSGEITNLTMKDEDKIYDIKIAEGIDTFTKRLGEAIVILLKKPDVSNNAEQGNKETDTKAS